MSRVERDNRHQERTDWDSGRLDRDGEKDQERKFDQKRNCSASLNN